MALSSAKLVNLSPSVVGSRQPRPNRLTVLGFERSPPVQVNSEIYCQQRLPPQPITASRRDVMLRLMGTSLAAVNILSAESADARIVKPEIRRKIREKLEMLREKAGITKSPSDDKSSSDKGKMLPSPPPPLYPQDILPGGPLVEMNVPEIEITP